MTAVLAKRSPNPPMSRNFHNKKITREESEHMHMSVGWSVKDVFLHFYHKEPPSIDASQARTGRRCMHSTGSILRVEATASLLLLFHRCASAFLHPPPPSPTLPYFHQSIISRSYVPLALTPCVCLPGTSPSINSLLRHGGHF